MIPLVTILTLINPTGTQATPTIPTYPNEMACGEAIPKAVAYFFPDDQEEMRGWSLHCDPTKRLSQSPIPPLRKVNQ